MQSTTPEFAFDFGHSRRNIILIVLVLILLTHKPLLLIALLAGAYYLRAQGKSEGQRHNIVLKKKNSPPNVRRC
jgi:hypothetical protein